MPPQKMSLPAEERTPDRPRTHREVQVEQRWGRLASILRLMSDDTTTTATWRRSEEGGRLSTQLDMLLGDSVVSLHHRRVPHSHAEIEHLVVASSGVWVIGTAPGAGRVTSRDVGTRREPDHRLVIAGQDRTRLLEAVEWQDRVVRAALEPLELLVAPVHPALVVVGADWGLFAKPVEIHGVRVLWAKRLCQAIAEPGPWGPQIVDAVGRQLTAALPPAR